jgi:hypothetical protein
MRDRFVERAALDRLGDEIAELAAHLHAATYELLVRLREFDERAGWGRGFRSCAHWLSWRTGIDLGAAREKVRVARALGVLPHLSDGMRRGELSYAKVRALSRVATSENESQLLEVARHGTAAHMERIVRAWRRVDHLEEQALERRRHDSRHLTLYADEDGSYVIRGRLDPEVGALLERALAGAMHAIYRKRRGSRRANDPAQDPTEDAVPAQRRADALGLVAEGALRSGYACPDECAAGRSGATGSDVQTSRADRFQVVLHVDTEALRRGSECGQSILEGGVHVSAETSRRIACDASRVNMCHDTSGDVLNVERRTRTVPASIRRALAHRDRGCRFPGCGLRICDAHHIEHWADGGETRLRNLVLLCRRHHRAVHEEGFRVDRQNTGEIRFFWPNGRPFPVVPPAPRLPEKPTEQLIDRHRETGIEINAWTPTPHWHGEKLDLDWAILTLRGSVRRPAGAVAVSS